MPHAPTLNAPASATSPNGNQPASTVIAEQVGRSLDVQVQPYRVDVVAGTSSANQAPSSAEATTLPPGGAIAIEIRQNAPILAVPGELLDNQPEELSIATFNLAPSGGLWLQAITQ